VEINPGSFRDETNRQCIAVGSGAGSACRAAADYAR
jgi:hypothetical protein